MGELVNLENIQVLAATVAFVDSEINSMTTLARIEQSHPSVSNAPKRTISPSKFKTEKFLHVLKMLQHTRFLALGLRVRSSWRYSAQSRSGQDTMHDGTVIEDIVDHVPHGIEIVFDEILHGGRLFPPPGALQEIRKKIIDFHSSGYTIVKMESPLLLQIRKELKE